MWRSKTFSAYAIGEQLHWNERGHHLGFWGPGTDVVDQGLSSWHSCVTTVILGPFSVDACVCVVLFGVLHSLICSSMLWWEWQLSSLPPTPPLQGGDCTLYSLLRVSGEWNEPGPFCVAVNQDFVFRRSAYFRLFRVFAWRGGREGTFAAEGFKDGVRTEKKGSQTRVLGVNRESSLWVLLRPGLDCDQCLYACSALAVTVCLLSAPFCHVFVYDLAVNAALSWLRLPQRTHTDTHILGTPAEQ